MIKLEGIVLNVFTQQGGKDKKTGAGRFDELNLPGGTGCAFYQGYAG